MHSSAGADAHAAASLSDCRTFLLAGSLT